MHTASRIVLIFLFLLSPIWAYASGDILSAWKQIRGNTTSQWETRYITYSEDSEFEPENHFLESSLEVNSSAILSDRWFLESTPELRWDRANKVGSGSHYNERGLDRSGITLKHWTINYSGEASELSVGKQTFSWGKGELFSPADDLSPIDQLDLASSEKLGVTAFTTRYFADKFSTEFVLLPTFTPNRMPPNNNRWTRDTTALEQTATSQPGFTPTLNFGERILPDRTIENAQYGLRFASSEWRSGWDFELSFLRGFEPHGVYQQALSGTILNLNPVYPEYQQVGAGFSTSWGEIEFHSEVAWHDTRDQLQDDDYLSYVLGSRYSFYRIPWSETIDEITLTLEYVGESIMRQQTAGSAYLSTGFGRALTNSFLNRLVFKFSEETSLEVGSFINLDQNDYSAQIKGTHRPSDTLEYSFSLDAFEGPVGSFFGEWSNNHRASLAMTYYF